ncbi:FAD:protein FMN transferase [Peptostreptococcus faecalis]|uniref:FAD:protein FMN transferase n=1 Tax=Peptostreptococcus faecalis TaxID=2045015 RepID=UPI000C7BC0E1|nr:FAD:protein FMN transferase [Peptostreptococcus faecalis]
MQKNNIKIVASLATLVLLSALFFYGNVNKKGTYSTTNYYLDTINQVSLINVKEKKANKILEKVDNIILNINNDMSSHLPGSLVTKINKNAGISPVKVNDDTYEVIKKSISYSKKTNGNFDVSIGALTSLWNIGNKNAKVPTSEELSTAISSVGYKNIILDDKKQTVYLEKKGQKIDLGGIAKGYCADKIVKYLKSEDIDNAIIDLGGNIYVLGKNAQNKDFNVGIQNPGKKSEDSMGSLYVSNKSVVTSGIYQRFLESDGKIYHHMLNPFTGYPFDNNLSSVTIVSEKSLDGDALSTSAFALDIKDGKKMIEGINGVDAIFITKDNKVYITNGLKNNFKITNKKYTLAN